MQPGRATNPERCASLDTQAAAAGIRRPLRLATAQSPSIKTLALSWGGSCDFGACLKWVAEHVTKSSVVETSRIPSHFRAVVSINATLA